MKKYCSYGRRAIGIFGFRIFLLGNGLTKTGAKNRGLGSTGTQKAVKRFN